MRGSEPITVVALSVVLGVSVTACGDGAVEGLHGRLLVHDDTGRGSWLVEEGWIAALPGVRAVDLWPDAFPPGTTDDTTHLVERLDVGAISAAGGNLVTLGRGGWFTLDVPPGPALVCLLDGTPESLYTSGCDELDLPRNGRLSAGWGEGGFIVSLDD